MTRTCDDAAALLHADTRPDVMLSARDADTIREALRLADVALHEAMGSKLRAIRTPSREARIKVQSAWALLHRLTTARKTEARDG